MSILRGWFEGLVGRVLKLLTETDSSLAEFWSSTALMAMGVWLIIPFSPDTFAAVPVYRVMGAVFPEWAWGLISLGLGGLQSAANITRRRDSRRAAAFVGSVFFGFMWSLALLSLPASLLVPLLGTAAFVEGIIFLHLRKREPRAGQ